MRILLVDNDGVLARSLQDLFVVQEANLDYVLSAQAGWQKLREGQRYDAILIDASEDVLIDGEQSLCELIRQHYPTMERIALTGEYGALEDTYAQERYHAIIIKGLMPLDAYYSPRSSSVSIDVYDILNGKKLRER